MSFLRTSQMRPLWKTLVPAVNATAGSYLTQPARRGNLQSLLEGSSGERETCMGRAGPQRPHSAARDESSENSAFPGIPGVLDLRDEVRRGALDAFDHFVEGFRLRGRVHEGLERVADSPEHSLEGKWE